MKYVDSDGDGISDSWEETECNLVLRGTELHSGFFSNAWNRTESSG